MRRKPDIQSQIFLVLAAGFVAGTFFAIFPGRSYVGELGILSPSYRRSVLEGSFDMWGLFAYILIQRLMPVILLLAFSRTRFRGQMLLLFCLWGSFSLGIYWSGCILSYRFWGILLFFAAFLPQGILYVMGWVELGNVILHYSRNRGALFLPFLMLILGAAAEAWIHPHLLHILFSFL